MATHTRIKICGLTQVNDARAILACGVDAIGLVFYEGSRRCVDQQTAAAIAAAVGPFVSVVGLFVNPSAADVKQVLASVPLQLLQFHGDESASFCQQFNRPYLKALRIAAPPDTPTADIGAVQHQVMEQCQDYASAAGILLDTHTDKAYGGTGEVFNWDCVPPPEASLPPWILAGGLTPDNVAHAIARTHPYAVDVSSGVESSPGVKDAKTIAAFVRAVRGE